MNKLLDFLTNLEKAQISYSLKHKRDEAMMVLVTVPGERWEIEFFADDSVEVEVFKSSGEIKGELKLERLFAEFTG